MIELAFMIEASCTNNLEQRVFQAFSTDIYPPEEVLAFGLELGKVVETEGLSKGGYLRNGVSPETYRLIIDSTGFGLHQGLPDLTREAMRHYFGSGASTRDLKVLNGFNEETNRKYLHRGLGFLHQELSRALREQGIDQAKFLEMYPPTLALRIKEIHNRVALSKRTVPLTNQGKEHDLDTKRAIAIGQILHQNGTTDPDLRLWRYAQKNHLFGSLKSLTRQERVELRHYYEEKGAADPSRELLDRFAAEVGVIRARQLIEEFAPEHSTELKTFYLSQTLPSLETVARHTKQPVSQVRAVINRVLDDPDLKGQWQLLKKLIGLPLFIV